jgi:hypothetical protein
MANLMTLSPFPSKCCYFQIDLLVHGQTPIWPEDGQYPYEVGFYTASTNTVAITIAVLGQQTALAALRMDMSLPPMVSILGILFCGFRLINVAVCGIKQNKPWESVHKV